MVNDEFKNRLRNEGIYLLLEEFIAEGIFFDEYASSVFAIAMVVVGGARTKA